MEDVILIIAVVAAMIFVFFIANRLDVFLEENRKAIKKEHEEKYSPLDSLTQKTMKIRFPRSKTSKNAIKKSLLLYLTEKIVS